MTDITGTDDADSLTGGAEHDLIGGLDGDDTLTGGAGADLLYGGGGMDWLHQAAGGDTAYGGHGADTFYDPNSWGGPHSTLYGGAGIDILYLTDWLTAPITFLSVADPTGWQTLSDGTRFTGIERLRVTVTEGDCTLIGGQYDDTLQALSDGDDALFGGGGNDYVLLRYGADSVYGGTGDDLLIVMSVEPWDRPDVLDGGPGRDMLSISFEQYAAGSDLSLNSRSPQVLGNHTTVIGFEEITVTGSNFADTVTGGDFTDQLYAMDGADVLRGHGGDDWVMAGDGDDTLSGGAGGDYLDGGPGSNRLFGGDGSDRLILSAVNDTATGGNGADAFEIQGWPDVALQTRITDFSAQDTIILSNNLLYPSSAWRLSPRDFVLGTAAQDGSDRILYDAGTGAVWFDRDGTGWQEAVLFLHLTPGTTLTAADILLL